MQQSYANNFSSEACVKELKKQDLFDLGIVLTLAATGGLEMINEELDDISAHNVGSEWLLCVESVVRNKEIAQERTALMKQSSRYACNPTV